jgi:hypothetical protein
VRASQPQGRRGERPDGLRRRLLVEVPERSDEEIAAEEIGGDPVLIFGQEAWRKVTRRFGLPTRIQEAYDGGGLDAVLALLVEHDLVP